jgi:hypothetical protein
MAKQTKKEFPKYFVFLIKYSSGRRNKEIRVQIIFEMADHLTYS